MQTAARVWPNAAMPGQMSQDLPTWTHFEQLAELVTAERVAERVVCGPSAESVVALVRQYVAAGFDHLHFHQVGPDQAGFLRFWQHELGDALEALDAERARVS